ncbi:uncharacterized protein [Clinocottus analis]|uniref:uncharacterized protein n=1 Tax=Clinocottus analis TaxID=304258 RepID=UPI0035C0D816
MEPVEERLAEEVRKYEHLYNPSLAEFKDTQMAVNSWREISANLGMQVEECTRLWRKLRDKFVRQKKSMRSSRNGAGGRKHVPALYHSLLWLAPHIKHRKTSSHYDKAPRRRERELDPKEQAESELLEQRRAPFMNGKEEDEETRFAAALVDVLRSMPAYKRLEARRRLYNIAVDMKQKYGPLSFLANMTGVLTGLLRARRALAHNTGVMIQPRASYIRGKPPKDKIGAGQTIFVLTVMTVTLLGPSGWILGHLDEYKSRR